MIFNLIRNGFSLEDLLFFLIMIPLLMFSLSIHEYAHAFAAHKQGDDYARMMGRMTINPLKHLDPWGFLMLLLLGFGWAKPVPIVPANFRNGRKSMILVSIAGVVTNLLLAFMTINIWCFLDYICGLDFMGNQIVYSIFDSFIKINISLCVFNLIPLPPLDGYKVVREFFYSFNTRNIFAFLDRHGTIILMMLIIFGGTSGFIEMVSGYILRVFGWI